MSNSTIKLKSSTTAGNTPSSLETGEFAINVADGNLFYGSASAVKQDLVLETLTVKGSLTAENYIVSSSVTYMTQSFSSGSTIFGDTLDDTHQFTGSILYTGSLDINGMTYPTTDGVDGQTLQTDGTGNLTFEDTNQIFLNVKNKTGAQIDKGTPLYASGSSGNGADVYIADASDPSKMPAAFIAREDIAIDAEGKGVISGFVNGIDTSGFSAGDTIYVAGGGGYTNIKPTGSALIQNIGKAVKIDEFNGSLVVVGAGRSNDVPNLLDNQIFFGSGSNQSQQIHISGALDSTVINHITASGNISASGTITANAFVGDGSGITGLTSAAISSYTNASANRVITSENSSGVNAEAFLNFSNQEGLIINNAASGLVDTGLKVHGNIFGSGSHIRLRNPDGGGGNGFYLSSSGDLAATTFKLHFGDIENQGNNTTLIIDDANEQITTSKALSVTGNITVTGTVDGVDIASLENSVQANDTEIASLTAATSSYLTSSPFTAAGISGSFNSVSASLAADIPTNNNQLTNGAGYLTTVDISTDTNLAVGNGITLTGDTLTVTAGTGLTQNAGGLAFDADGGTLTTNNADVDHILINDGGVFKRITKGNINVGDFNNNVGYLTSSPFTAAGISGSFDSVSASLASDIPTNNNQLTNGAGYTTNTGTVTSVGGTGTVSGLSLSGTVTTSGNLTLGGTISLVAGDIPTITSAKISDVDAFSQSGTYASLRAQGTTAGDVGLGNVTNESKATMFTNAALTGNPTAPTPLTSDNDTSIATTAFVKAQGYTTNTGTVDTSGTPVDNDFAKFTDANTIEGRSYSEVKTDLSLNNVENTALSTYTGNGGSLDNQYIANGAGYTTNTGTVTSVGGTGTVSGLSLSGTVTTSGNLTLGGTISISSTNITDVDAFSQTGTYASLRAQGTTAGDVGLGNVTNESKATMFTSPTFTGTTAAPTPSTADDSTKIATTAYVQANLDNLIGNAGAALDTLGELSASLADATGSIESLVTEIDGKLAKSSNLSDLTNAATARTNLGVDAAGTDNSTDVTLAGSYDYITISDQQITRNQVDASTDISNLTTTNVSEGTNEYYTDAKVKTKLNTESVISGSATQVRSFLNVEDGADVTDTANVTAAGALMDSEVDADIKTLSLPANTTISTFGASLIDDTTAGFARTTLGLGSIATAASGDYVSINGDTLDGGLDLNTYNVTNVGDLRATTVSGSTFVSDGVTVLSTPDVQTIKIGQSAGGSGPMRVSIVSNDTQYGLFSNSGIQLTGSVSISSTLSIPGFADVSASLAAAVAGGDNLGNHTATQNLNLDGNDIINVSNITTATNSDLTIDPGGTGNILLKSTDIGIQHSGVGAGSLNFYELGNAQYTRLQGQTVASNITVSLPTSTGTLALTSDIDSVSASLAADIPTNNNQLTNGAGYTTNTGTVTSVATGNGLTGGTITSTGTLSIDYQGTSNIITLANVNASGYSAGDDFIIRYNENDEEVQKTSIADFKSGYNLVDTSGTPADNQIAIFTDSNTVEGTSELTYNGTTLNIDGLLDIDADPGAAGSLVDINNTRNGGLTGHTYALRVRGGDTQYFGGTSYVAYGGYFEAGTTTAATTGHDTIALYAQAEGYNDAGDPYSYAAIFSGSGGTVGINTMQPTVELDVVGDVSASGNLSIGGIPNVSASIAAASGGGGSDNLGNHIATQDLDLNSNNIKGITHITASGNISASGIIVPQYDTKVSTFFTSDANGDLIPMGGTLSETTTPQYYINYMSPYGGQLIRAYVMTTSSSTGTFTLSLRRYTAFSTFTTIATATGTINSSYTPTLATFSAHTFNAGDWLAIYFDPTGIPSGVNVTSLWRMDSI